MAVGDGQNPDGVGLNKIGDIIRKNRQVDSAITLWPEMGHIEILSDPFDCVTRLFLEPEAEVTFPGFVLGDSFV